MSYQQNPQGMQGQGYSQPAGQGYNQPASDPFGSHAGGSPAPGSGGPKKKTGLIVGLVLGGLVVLGLIIALIANLMNVVGKGSSKDASSTSSDGQSYSKGDQGEAEKTVSTYVDALRDGKAQDALKKMDTDMVGLDPDQPYYKDEVYSKAKNRPEGFSRTDSKRVSDDWYKVSGTVKQKSRDLPVEYDVRRIGGEWKVAPRSSYVSLPHVYASGAKFPVTVNGVSVSDSSSTSATSMKNPLPGDYEISSINNTYFTTKPVTATAWADGSKEGSSGTSKLEVKPTAEAQKTVVTAVTEAMKTCAAKLDHKTCGREFNAYSSQGKLEGLKVTIAKMPVIEATAGSSSPNRFTISTTTKGTMDYDAKLNGQPVQASRDLDISGSATMSPEGKVQELKLY
ncbi:hypothetical protein [Falsarthrobacter nasiphocae]|uniref:Uncharacterized protein n=1 Tax=Falsarthrobacter nasiphocae TaxID=189863 RepID=A0AAE3YG25_9MICC|nr:hypothetical protein [Falsarthrobacter nasiphocae]MDR6892112.1 hypothetical protein [Falsarthrobacter nasiphocae]